MRLFLLLVFTLSAWAEVLWLDVPLSEYQVTDNAIIMENAAYINIPGAPNIPCKKLTIALPPGALFEYAKFYGTREEITELTVLPAQPPMPLMDDEAVAQVWDLYETQKEKFYSSDKMYPQTYGTVLSKGGLRKYTLIDIVCYPFAYRPVSQELYYTPNIKVEIHYSMPAPESERAQFWQNLIDDITFNEIAQEMIYNWNDCQIWYHTDTPRRANGYTIIIPAALQNSVDDLVTHRQSQGYDVNVVTKEYIEVNVVGDDLAQKIRNYLRENMADIEYVLVVGHITDIPMRMCVPFNNDYDSPYDDPDFSPIPTDLYYAELTDSDSLSWNSDGDSYFGEVFNPDFEPVGDDNPDYHADVHVGRIPTSTQSVIEDICEKFIVFDSNTDLDYKTASLLAGGMIFFENENYGGYPLIDGADEMEQLIDDYVFDRSNAVTLYEKAGLIISPYPCTDSLTRINQIFYWNRKGIMYEYNHGSPYSYARKIWAWDDGDSIPESPEIQWFTCLQTGDAYQLDNEYPATTFLRSCLCGKPEEYGLGPQLLHYGSSTVICGSRVVWVKLADQNGTPYYFFKRLMIDTIVTHGIVGNAFSFARVDFMESTGFWITAYTFNLYGDPALHQYGSNTGIEETDKKIVVPTFFIFPNPTSGTVTIQSNSLGSNKVELNVYDECGRFVQALYHGYLEVGAKEIETNLSTGVYFIRFKQGESTQVKKFVVVY